MTTEEKIKKQFPTADIFYEDDNYVSFIVPWHLLHTTAGWGNGYVGIKNPKHPWFSAHYDNIDVDVHGGLTYSDYTDDATIWIVGFDTGHCQDDINIWPKYRVIQEVTDLLGHAKQIIIK